MSEHDERCEELLSFAGRVIAYCRCAERALTAARQREEEAKANADFLRESIGECHVMISRNLAEFQLRHDWEATTLPHLLQRILLERDALRAENDRLTLAASESARTLQVEIAAQQEQAGMVIGELKARVAELQGLNEQLNRHEHELSNQVTALREALASIRADIVKHDRYFSGAQDWRCEDCCGEWPDENGTPPEKTDGLECDARRTLVIVDAALAAIPQDGA